MNSTTIKLLYQYPYNSKTINLDNKNISGILDLRRFINLKTLLCSNNQITELTGLANSVEILGCANNQITKLILPEYLTKTKIFNNPVKILYYTFDKEISNFAYYKDTLETVIFSDDYNYLVDPIGFDKLKSIHLGTQFDQPLDNLSSHPIEKIKFKSECIFNQPINNLPNSMKKIIFDSDSLFNQPIDNLPNNLKHLELGDSFNQQVNHLPNSINKLIIGNLFNHPVDNLPSNLKFLKLGETFNLPVDNLPSGLEYLEIGYEFNHLIDNLPPSLLYLQIGSKFRNEIKSLPNGLLEISLGRGFDAPVDNFPQTLKKIRFSRNFNQSVDNLPKNLINLTLSRFFQKTIDLLPDSLETLFIGEYFYHPIDNLPNSLRELEFDIEMAFNKSLDNLPNQLEKLTLGMGYSGCLDNLPQSLKYLNIYSSDRIINNLPENLINLTIGDSETKINNLPDKLETLDLYTRMEDLVLPSGLKNLIIHNYNNKVLKEDFPPNLEYLKLGLSHDSYNFVKSLPDNLKKFSLGCNSDYGDKKLIINNNLIFNLPKSLEYINLDGYISKDVINSLPPNLKDCSVFVSKNEEIVFY